MKRKLANIRYTARHWLAYQKTAWNLGLWRFRFLLHDVDKLFLYLIFKKETVSKMHRFYSTHHINKETYKVIDPLAAVIDWECSRFTKPDKPWNAIETFEKFYPNAYCVLPWIWKIEQRKLKG